MKAVLVLRCVVDEVQHSAKVIILLSQTVQHLKTSKQPGIRNQNA
jgi:hypothetical protein